MDPRAVQPVARISAIRIYVYVCSPQTEKQAGTETSMRKCRAFKRNACEQHSGRRSLTLAVTIRKHLRISLHRQIAVSSLASREQGTPEMRDRSCTIQLYSVVVVVVVVITREHLPVERSLSASDDSSPRGNALTERASEAVGSPRHVDRSVTRAREHASPLGTVHALPAPSSPVSQGHSERLRLMRSLAISRFSSRDSVDDPAAGPGLSGCDPFNRTYAISRRCATFLDGTAARLESLEWIGDQLRLERKAHSS